MPYSPLQLAEAFIQAGELAEALQALNQQLEAHPDDEEARRLRIGLLLRLDGPDHLEAALADFERLPNPHAGDYLQRSVVLERSERLAEALQAMAHAYALLPGDQRLAERYLQLLMRAEKIDLALNLVHTLPRTWRWLQWEGDLLVMAGKDMMATARYGLALAQLDQSFDMQTRIIAPIKARLLLARAHAYRRQQDFEQAAAHYRAAAALITDDPTIPFSLGLLAALRGEQEEALTLCRQGWTAASAALQKEMEQALRGSPYYHLLAQRLLDMPA